MYMQQSIVKCESGLYNRQATYFIQKANEFKSSIWVEKDDRGAEHQTLRRRALGKVRGNSLRNRFFPILHPVRSGCRGRPVAYCVGCGGQLRCRHATLRREETFDMENGKDKSHVFAEQHHVAAPVIGDQFRVNVLQLQSPDNRCLLPDRRICVPQVAVQVQDADHSRRHQ